MVQIKNNNSVAILMATYNGEKYACEQIDSLLSQTCDDWHLYIHDDGSSDNTVSIIHKYENDHPEKITLLHYPSQGGACRNFLSMLEKIDSQYYMFCDQDDVWFPEKVDCSLKEIRKQEFSSPGRAVIVCTDLLIVDQKLNTLYDSMWQYSGIYPQYLKTFDDCAATAAVTGCTMLFNKDAKECCHYPSSAAMMHDSWFCLCTLKNNGILSGIHKPMVYYRQHEANCLGAGGTEVSAMTLSYRIKHFKKMFNINRRYYTMLASLGYGSVFKYIRYKLMYKKRIKQGHY